MKDKYLNGLIGVGVATTLMFSIWALTSFIIGELWIDEFHTRFFMVGNFIGLIAGYFSSDLDPNRK